MTFDLTTFDPAARQEVLAVYAEADAAVAAFGPRCDASGRCCRFTEYGHTLFISAFEAALLLENAPPFEQPVTRDGCPFQIDGLCTARENRPLGCRIYFCDPVYETRMAEITEGALSKLKQIADARGTGWNYAPLHHFLNARPRTETTDSMTPPVTRVPLPVVNHSGG